ncbi:conserved hypothetical protein [Vibrio coralliirubri]|uniref:DUF2513 domain-containing protein n=1 Tax=Vibrio coralliirubri TaxID=1516159 RepID=UPI00062FDE24|nr:DUF2513 domain-containing protein [Vibrio coralliirubri]CDT98147.1 conserved hypothetical protein [Vibrio coralliirubri]
MRIDLDYFRQLLDVFIEAETAHITYADMKNSGITIFDDEDNDIINQKFLFHLQLLIDNKLISTYDMACDSLRDFGISMYLDGEVGMCDADIRLTQAGHDFASSLHNKEVIEKLKSELKDMPFKIIFEGGQKLLQHYAKKKLDALLAE